MKVEYWQAVMIFLIVLGYLASLGLVLYSAIWHWFPAFFGG